MAFLTSSHALKWLFKAETLRAIKEETNLKATNLLQRHSDIIPITPATELANSMGSSTMSIFSPPPPTMMSPNLNNIKNPTPNAMTKTPADNKLLANSYLTIEEESIFKSYFETKLEDSCNALINTCKASMDLSTKATAITYFKRFYLHNSLLENDHELLIASCIFLASKIEEKHFQSEEEDKPQQIDGNFLKKHLLPKHELEQLIECEKKLLNGLKYHLIVFHPFRSLRGLFLKHLQLENLNDLAGESLELYKAALEFIRRSLKSDCTLLYTPGEIALAALKHAVVSLPTFSSSMPAIDGLLDQEFTPMGREEYTSKLNDIERIVDAVITEWDETQMKVIKKIHKKLSACKSELFPKMLQSTKRKREDEESNRENKRIKKEEEKIKEENALLM